MGVFGALLDEELVRAHKIRIANGFLRSSVLVQNVNLLVKKELGFLSLFQLLGRWGDDATNFLNLDALGPRRKHLGRGAR